MKNRRFYVTPFEITLSIASLRVSIPVAFVVLRELIPGAWVPEAALYSGAAIATSFLGWRTASRRSDPRPPSPNPIRGGIGVFVIAAGAMFSMLGFLLMWGMLLDVAPAY